MTVRALIKSATTMGFHHIERFYFHIPVDSEMGRKLVAIFSQDELKAFSGGGNHYKILLPIQDVAKYQILCDFEVPALGIFDSKTLAILPK